MNKTTTNKTKQKKRTIISLLLIGAILIGGAFAFLTAQDSKTNVFTIGNISINLVENFDADGDGVTEKYKSDKKTPPTRENIIPGVDIVKEPYVENTSNNPCRLYMTVKVPTLTKAEAYVQNDGDAYTLDGEKKIEVTAYAIQDGYADKTDSTEIWTEYFNKNVSFGDEYAGSADDRIQMFDIKDVNTTEWNLMSTFQSVDGNNYYTYVYVGNGNNLLAAGGTSVPLFTKVALVETIGNTIA